MIGYQYKGHKFTTTDPYELAGEMMEIDDAPEGDEALCDQYFQRAEALIRQTRILR